jgi:hypothetical protein
MIRWASRVRFWHESEVQRCPRSGRYRRKSEPSADIARSSARCLQYGHIVLHHQVCVVKRLTSNRRRGAISLTGVDRNLLAMVFADRWIKALPRRWARNCAIFGAVISFAPLLGTTRHVEQMVQNGGLFWMALGAVFLVVPLTLTSFVIGFWARIALLRAPDGGWVSAAESILFKWTIGAALLGLLIALAATVERHGSVFSSDRSMAAVAENMTYAVGVLGASTLLGFVIGLVSRRGLRRAILDDEVTSRER